VEWEPWGFSEGALTLDTSRGLEIFRGLESPEAARKVAATNTQHIVSSNQREPHSLHGAIRAKAQRLASRVWDFYAR
jgi:hypothetical protein